MIRKTLFLFLLFLSFSLNIAAEESERINHQALDRHMGDRHADASEGFHAL